jgi:hypothetical protein
MDDHSPARSPRNLVGGIIQYLLQFYQLHSAPHRSVAGRLVKGQG